MTDATTDFFQDLGGRGQEPLLQRATGTVRVDLSNGKRTEHWLVTIEKGNVTVSKKNARADCVARADKTTFDGIVRGEVNATAALLRGRMDFEGDPWLLVLFQRLFPGPPGATGRPPAPRKKR
jgi:putative sterol carrier protein